MSDQFTSVVDLDVDLLVIGGGMAGLTGAALAASRGARVALVDVAPATGGSAQYAGYAWTAESFERLREVDPQGDPELGRVLVDGLAPGLDWIRSLGVDVGPPVVVLGYGTGHAIDMATYLARCTEIVATSGTLLTETVTERLTFDGRVVTGAVLRGADGARRTVRGGAVLLATGGFGADPEQRAARIHPGAREIALRGNPHSVGTGLRLAREVGATFVGDDAGFYGHLIPSGVRYDPADYIGLTFYHSEHGLLLNLDGGRFVDETIGDHLNALAVLEQPEGRALLVCDERVHRDWMLEPYVGGAEVTDKFRLAYERGARAAIATELDELAYLPEEWGYPGAAVRDAVAAHNAQCAAGGPVPSRELDPSALVDPPYYVIEVVPALTNAWGGIRIDRQARVVDADGTPIAGLYAAGADVGGVFHRAYAGGVAVALAFAMRAVDAVVGSGA